MAEEKPEPCIDWDKNMNIPYDAVQYWGKCRGCGAEAFVSPWMGHMCSQCVVKNRPPSTSPALPEIEAEPWKDDEPTSTTVVSEKTEVMDVAGEKVLTRHTEYKIEGPPKKRGRPKGSKNRVSYKKAREERAYTGPVGKWVYDEAKKGWVVRDNRGWVVRFNKDKPAEADEK